VIFFFFLWVEQRYIHTNVWVGFALAELLFSVDRSCSCPVISSGFLGHYPEGLFEMTKFANSVKKFLVSEDGPTAVEYAVMLALIIVVCLAAISTIGGAANSRFQQVGSYL